MCYSKIQLKYHSTFTLALKVVKFSLFCWLLTISSNETSVLRLVTLVDLNLKQCLVGVRDVSAFCFQGTCSLIFLLGSNVFPEMVQYVMQFS